jgi:hypothetical protein
MRFSNIVVHDTGLSAAGDDKQSNRDRTGDFGIPAHCLSPIEVRSADMQVRGQSARAAK